MVTLWPHQESGAHYLRSNGQGLLLWEPRCGKTFTAIKAVESCERVLVICPNSAKFVWKDDFAKFGREVAYNTGRAFDPSAPILAMNYESAVRADPLRHQWDAIIFDEIHRLGSWHSGTTRYFMESDRLPQIRIGLTGTLCPEGFQQAVAPFSIIYGSWFWHGYTQDGPPWVSETRQNWIWNSRQFKHDPRPGHIIRCAEWLRINSSSMTQEQAGIFARKTYRQLSCPSDGCEKLYRQALALPEPERRFSAIWQASSGLQDGRMMFPAPKLEQAVGMVADYKAEGNAVVVLCRHTATIRYLAQRFADSGFEGRVIDGKDEGVVYRQKVVDELNSGKLDVILAQVECVKVAINLSKAKALIYVENSWSGEARIQSEERLTCKGKEEGIDIIDLCTRFQDGESLDAKCSAVVRMKKDFNSSCF